MMTNPCPFSSGWPSVFQMSQCNDGEEAGSQRSHRSSTVALSRQPNSEVPPSSTVSQRKPHNIYRSPPHEPPAQGSISIYKTGGHSLIQEMHPTSHPWWKPQWKTVTLMLKAEAIVPKMEIKNLKWHSYSPASLRYKTKRFINSLT